MRLISRHSLMTMAAPLPEAKAEAKSNNQTRRIKMSPVKTNHKLGKLIKQQYQSAANIQAESHG